MNSIKNAFSGKILGEQTKSCEEFTPFLSSSTVRFILRGLAHCYPSSSPSLLQLRKMTSSITRFSFRDSDIVTLGREQKRLQPSRDEPEDAPSFTRRLKNSARPLPNPFSRRLEYPPIQE